MCLKFTSYLLVALRLVCDQCERGAFSDTKFRLAQQQTLETKKYPEQRCDPYCLKVMIFDPQYLPKGKGPPKLRWQGPEDLTTLEKPGASVSWDDLLIKYQLPSKFSTEAALKIPASHGKLFKGCGCNATQTAFIEPMFQCWDCMFWYMDRTGDLGFKERPLCVKAHQCPKGAGSYKYEWQELGSLSDNPGWEPPRSASIRGSSESCSQHKTLSLAVGIVVAILARCIT